MPEFLGRPNLPNALANSLVQLASQEENPLATALKTIGGLAEKAGDMAYDERKEKGKQTHDIKLKQMEIDARMTEHRAGLLTELVKNDQVVESLISSKPMNATDAAALRVPTRAAPTVRVHARLGPPVPPLQARVLRGLLPAASLPLGQEVALGVTEETTTTLGCHGCSWLAGIRARDGVAGGAVCSDQA